jgi:excisionase family DNA binding protein
LNRKGRLNMSTERLTHTVEEAGKLLGLSRNSAYALARTGELPTVRLGKRLLVPKAALERLLASAGAPNADAIGTGGQTGKPSSEHVEKSA